MKNIFSSLSFGFAVSLALVTGISPCRADDYNAITPCRLVDTRPPYPAALNIKGRFTNGDTRTIPFRNNGTSCTIPATATAVVINLTAVGPTAAGYLALYPGPGTTPPKVSNINFAAGAQAIANQAVVPLGTPDARIVAALQGDTDVLIDVSGYFAPTGAKFHAMAPCRLLDTRSYAGNSAPYQPPAYTRLNNGQTMNLRVQNNGHACTVPQGATAIFANLTAASPTGAGYLTLFPAASTLPNISTLNFQNGDSAIPNAVIVPLAAANPDLKLFAGAGAGGSVDAILDISGYFQ